MAQGGFRTNALWTMRYILLGSILVCAAALGLGVAGLIPADLAYVTGIVSGLAIEISAVLCVALQLAGLFRRRRRE
jgi:membrane protein implicated in regulation of membrane protease activity